MTELMTSALAGVTYGGREGAGTETGIFISLSMCGGGWGGGERTVLSLKMFLSVASPYVSGSSSGSFEHPWWLGG